MSDAFRRDLTVLDACNEWYSGAYLMETLPCVLYILMRHGDDTRDIDTVGASLGALYGAKAIPWCWRKNLLGRLGPDDDGRLFKLFDQTQRLWLRLTRPPHTANPRQPISPYLATPNYARLN